MIRIKNSEYFIFSASGGELHSFIDDEEGLTEAQVIKMMRQLLEALVYLHDKNIVHLDLKVRI